MNPPKWPTYLMGIRKKQKSRLTEDDIDPKSWLKWDLAWIFKMAHYSNSGWEYKSSPQKPFAAEGGLKWLKQYLFSAINHQSV